MASRSVWKTASAFPLASKMMWGCWWEWLLQLNCWLVLLMVTASGTETASRRQTALGAESTTCLEIARARTRLTRLLSATATGVETRSLTAKAAVWDWLATRTEKPTRWATRPG